MLSLSRWSIAAVAAAVLVAGVSTAAASSSGDAPNPAPHAVAPAAGALAAASSAQDLFTPITPCRILDTRLSTPMAANTTRTFYVTGTTGFAPQGGKSGGCGIPAGATAIAGTVTSVGSTATGWLTLYPAGAALPNASMLSYPKGMTITSGETTTIAGGAAKPLAIRVHAQTNVVFDVTGYYQHQIYGTFSDTGALYAGNGTLTAYSHGSTGSYAVQAQRDLSGCTVIASSYYFSYNASAYVSGNFVYVYLTNYDGSAVDYYFQLQVTC